jgi:hypothetical protein
VAAVWLAALLVVAWLAAEWFWRLTATDSVLMAARPIADPVLAAQSIATRHLMGDVDQLPGKSTTPRAAQYELSGAMTASPGRPGFAILVEPGKPPFPVLEGEDIAPGITLVKVLANKIEIRRQGRSEILEINDNNVSSGGAVVTAAAARVSMDSDAAKTATGGNEAPSMQTGNSR